MATFPLEEEKLAVPLHQFLVPEILTTLLLLLRHLHSLAMEMEVYLMKCITPVTYLVE